MSGEEVVSLLRLGAQEIRNDGTPAQVGPTGSELLQAADLIERQAKALDEAISVFELVEQPSYADPLHQDAIAALGSRIGFGALMAGASAEWRKIAIVRGSEFVSGPCHVTVVRTLEILRAARAALQEG